MHEFCRETEKGGPPAPPPASLNLIFHKRLQLTPFPQPASPVMGHPQG